MYKLFLICCILIVAATSFCLGELYEKSKIEGNYVANMRIYDDSYGGDSSLDLQDKIFDE